MTTIIIHETGKPTRDLAKEAFEALAKIATLAVNSNSEPDVMAAALDDAIGTAQAFFKRNPENKLADFL